MAGQACIIPGISTTIGHHTGQLYPLHVDRSRCRPTLLHNRRLGGVYGFFELAIFLLGAFQDVELLGVGEFAIAEYGSSPSH